MWRATNSANMMLWPDVAELFDEQHIKRPQHSVGPEPEKRATNCSQLYKFVSLSPKGTSRSRVKTRVMPLPEWHRPATSDSSVSETNRAVRMFAFCTSMAQMVSKLSETSF